MRRWLTGTRNHKQSLDDPFPGGFLYARSQEPDPNKDPPPKDPPPNPDDQHGDDDDDDPASDKIDPERFKKLVKHNRDLRRDRDAMAVATAKKDKELEAYKKSEEDRKKAAMSESDRLKLESQEKDRALAEKDSLLAQKDRELTLAIHQIDPEYLEAVDVLLARAMKTEGEAFSKEAWFKTLKEKKPAFFLGSGGDPNPVTTGGGPQRTGTGESAAVLTKKEKELETLLKNRRTDPLADAKAFKLRMEIDQLRKG